MTNSLVLTSVDGNVATVTINRPDKRNAVNQAMWQAIGDAVTALAIRADVSVLVVRGVGDHFCAGADISELSNGPGGEYGRVNWRAEEALVSFPGPTIAVVRGNCVGGGVSIATSCDIRVAASDATFGVTPAKLGIVYPANSLQRLVALVGPSTAKHMVYSGDLFDAEFALRVGLVNEVVSTDALNERVSALVAAVSARSSLTQHATKEEIAEIVFHGTVAHSTHDKWQEVSVAVGEVTEGVAAFTERRAPSFPWRRH